MWAVMVAGVGGAGAGCCCCRIRLWSVSMAMGSCLMHVLHMPAPQRRSGWKHLHSAPWLLTRFSHLWPVLLMKLHEYGVLLPWLAPYRSPPHVHLLSLLVVWNFFGIFRLVGGMCIGGGGVSQKLPAESCVGNESGGAVPSRVSGMCCDTAVVLRVTVMSCPRLVWSGGVFGSRRSV